MNAATISPPSEQLAMEQAFDIQENKIRDSRVFKKEITKNVLNRAAYSEQKPYHLKIRLKTFQ